MKAKTGAERQKAHSLAQKKKGLVKAWVWVYPDDRKDVRRYARELLLRRINSVTTE